MRKVDILIVTSLQDPDELSIRAPDGRARSFKKALTESGFRPGEECVVISRADFEAHFPAMAIEP